MGAPLPLARLRDGLRAWDLADADVAPIPPGVSGDVFLVRRGDDRWVAKYAYDHRDHFEVGLRVAQLVHDRSDLDVATAVRTRDGALTTMVEWPDELEHPLALLTYVDGDPIDDADPDAATIIGDVCGRVHAALLDVEPSDVGATIPPRHALAATTDDWLEQACVELDRRTLAIRDELRHAVSVWDGPDVRRTADAIGVIDFGICGWHPLVHVVANRSLDATLHDDDRMTPFLTALERHLPLTDAERDALPLYRALNAAVYARWVANERVNRRDPTFNADWFDALLALVRRSL